jgi:hypothetical protein
MRLEKYGDIVASDGGRYIITIALRETVERAKLAIARHMTAERAGKPVDTREARERGLLR